MNRQGLFNISMPEKKIEAVHFHKLLGRGKAGQYLLK
jgi:hypothetical protein